MFEFETTDLAGEFSFDNINASVKIGTFVFGGDDLAARDFHGAGKFVFVAMVSIDFCDDDLGDNVLFVSTWEVAVELTDFF